MGLNYIATVYNGIDLSIHKFYVQPDNPPYLAFIRRISPEKGTHLAIAIAKRSGWQLKMAGKLERVDVEYFEQEIQPYIDGKQIEYLGRVSASKFVALDTDKNSQVLADVNFLPEVAPIGVNFGKISV